MLHVYYEWFYNIYIKLIMLHVYYNWYYYIHIKLIMLHVYYNWYYYIHIRLIMLHVYYNWYYYIHIRLIMLHVYYEWFYNIHIKLIMLHVYYNWYHYYFAAVARCYGLICNSITDFLRGHVQILQAVMDFVNRYGPIMHPSDVIVYANTGIVRQHRHYRVILIVINYIIYKLCIFLLPMRFELRLIKLKRRVVGQLNHRGNYEQRG